ncbi:hypothetical protein niasHT_035238 [Heterodera trifolii]|uniref:non-specific serine/threonine protein kinase n=1 Tax=Heterodera trifolii TaxID=157864 RepID=A0ABD2IYV1_9BILA
MLLISDLLSAATAVVNAVIPRGVDTLLHIPAKLPDRLFPTLYVGESAQTGLYALPAFVDERTSTLAPKYLGPPLLEGPKPAADGTAEGASSSAPPTAPRKRPVLPPNTIMLSPTYITKEGEFLLLGYHHLPEATHTEHLFPVQSPHSTATHQHDMANNNRMLLLGQQSQNSQKRSPPIASADHFPHHYYGDGIGTGHPKLPAGAEFDRTHADSTVMHQNKAFLLMAGALLLLIIVFVISIFILRRYLRSYHEMMRPLPRRERLSSSASWGAASSSAATTALDGMGGDASWSSSRGSANSRGSRASSMHTAPETDHRTLQLGWHRVNEKLRYDSRAVLGRGCDGTFVYRGQFDGRDVAVKRVQALLSADNNWHRIIDREVTHLRESDSHPNVIRYFCSESDSYFSYIALELCDHTLEDFINHQRGKMERRLKLELLRQATDGIAHLHSIKIVHRDVKPKNILINGVAKGPPRVKISDFGLCKTVKLGHNSISKVSGVVGTEGWMAPELWDSTASVTYAIDVFSLGCVFFYVLTEGEHPFGDSNVRLYNISMNKFNLSKLDDSDHTARSLIASMLRLNGALRPTSSILVTHPIFWEPGKQLQFLLEVSDRIEKLESHDLIMRRLEWRRAVVVGTWLNRIDEPLKIDLLKQRSYQNNVRDLLRAIRNKKHHYQELSLELRTLLGRLPDEYIAYFTSRFPELLMHAFMALTLWAHENVFRRDFYPTDQLVEFFERERDTIFKTDQSPHDRRRRSSSPSNWRNASALSRAGTPTRNGVGTIVPPPNYAINNITADAIAVAAGQNYNKIGLQLPAFNPFMPPPLPPVAPPPAAVPNQHIITRPPNMLIIHTGTAIDDEQQQKQQQQQQQQQNEVALDEATNGVQPVTATPPADEQQQRQKMAAVATRSKAAKERAKKMANKRKRRRKAPFSVLASASSSTSSTAAAAARAAAMDEEEDDAENEEDAEEDEDSGGDGVGAGGDEAVQQHQKAGDEAAEIEGDDQEQEKAVESQDQPPPVERGEEKQSAGWEIVGGGR